MLGFSKSESSSNASDDVESSDQDNLSSINDSKDSGTEIAMTGPMIVM